MDRQPQASQDPAGRDSPVDSGPGPVPRPDAETQGRPALRVGPLLVRTVRHFFPRFNDWLDDLPDPRDPDRLTYDGRFLLWVGLFLFLCKLGSRRQIDFQLGEAGTEVLANLNRLAGTRQTTMPVNKTLDDHLARVGSTPVAGVRRQTIYRLVRMRVLDSVRLQGHYVVLIDGSGYLVFHQRHCAHCLTRQCGATTLYMHQVLEAKLLGPGGMVLSIATEFIDNQDAADTPAAAGEEKRKQDCELKALRRLAHGLRQEFPQLPICFNGDALNACGEGFAIAKDYNLSFIHVFKPGRMPALWQEFQDLLKLCPEQKVEVQTPQGVQQTYRWVNDLDYQDSADRPWRLNAIQCEETHPDGKKTQWSWLTWLKVTAQTVQEVATQGGRQRWCIENQGFNMQKNSGLNLEHAYSEGEHWAVYYYLLQIAHLLLQLLEKGSLLRQLAQEQGKSSAVAFFGSLKNMAERLLESLRNLFWPEEAYARVCGQIRFDSS
jgi:hypothetical protein